MNFKEKLKIAICNNDIKFLDENKESYSINDRFDDEDNDTLLLHSLSDSKSNVYNYLLENGADINLTNDENENAIHSIVFSSDSKRLKKILHKYQININHRSKDGATPLLLAISLEKNRLVRALLEHGADVNIADNEGIAPMHLASQSSNLLIVKLLLEKGANLFLKTNNGNLPLAMAVNQGNDRIVKFLFKKMYLHTTNVK